jgi:uncharacterized protein (DUF362 family)
MSSKRNDNLDGRMFLRSLLPFLKEDLMKHCPANHKPTLTRREFLKGAGALTAGLFMAGCASNSITTGVEKAGSHTGVRPTVAIAHADSYDRALVRKQVETLLDSIGGLGEVLAHGNRVAIKTNLTGGLSSGSLPGIAEIESFLTHPEVVRAVAELLRDAGVKDLFIVESVYEPESWPYYGYIEMAKEVGATLVDLNYAEPYPDFVKTPPSGDPFIYEDLVFNPILNEIDAFVSVSKMKCHNTCGVTHTMKNLVGLVPYRYYEIKQGDRYRSAMHGPGNETRRRLPRVIMDLNRARPVNLGIIDGIMTTEAGEGPWIPAMGPIKPGLLFAGKNPVATDSVATAAMGFDPNSDYPDDPFPNAENHLKIAASLGLGPNTLDQIEIVGAKLADVTVKFKPSY